MSTSASLSWDIRNSYAYGRIVLHIVSKVDFHFSCELHKMFDFQKTRLFVSFMNNMLAEVPYISSLLCFIHNSCIKAKFCCCKGRIDQY